MLNLDSTLFRVLNNLTGRYGALDNLGVFAAVFLLPLLAFLLVPAAFTIKRLREEHWYELPLKALFAAALAYGLRWIIGEIIARPRPFVALTEVNQLVPMDHLYDAFPSGHASLAFALAFVVWRHDRDWGVAFLILATLVAVGRVFGGVHYPLDVIGGVVVGWTTAWAVHGFEKREWSKLARALRVR